jgi:hypothetical protein
MKKLAAILGAGIATWLAIVLVCYAFLYKTVYAVYDTQAREVLQAKCGRIVQNELIYTLEPGACHFVNAEFDTVLSIDRDGFRNGPANQGDGPVKLAVIGDSYAMGWGVSQAETFASLIAGDRRFAVRNLAMSSYGTARELFALKRFAPDADIVVLQYSMNDWSENRTFAADPAKFSANAEARAAAYAKQLQTHLGRSALQSGVREVASFLVGHLAWSWRLLHLPPRRTTSPTPQRRMEEEAKSFVAVLSEFRSLLGGKTVIVLEALPRLERTNFAPTFRKALAAAGFRNMTVVDLVGELTPADYFHLDDHLRASGHAKIAARLLSALTEVSPGRAETHGRSGVQTTP